MFAYWIRLNWHDHGLLVSAVTSASSAIGAIMAPETIVLQWLGVPMPVMLASFAGGSCALSFLPRMGAAKSISTLLVCTVAAAYMVPITSWALNIPGNLQIGIAFLLSLFAQTLIGAAFTHLPEVLKKLLDAFVDRVRGPRL